MNAEDQTPENTLEMDTQAEQRMVAAFDASLSHNIPTMGAVERLTVTNEFLGTLGRLVSALEMMGHPTPGKAAAVLQLVTDMQLDKAGAYETQVIVVLTKTWERLRAEMRASKPA